MGVAASATYFLSDHIAIEASTGYTSQKIKIAGQGPQYDVNSNLKNNYPFHQSTKAGFIPFAAAVQYYLAPYGTLIPYIGGGYHYTFATASSESSVGNSRGMMFQAGIDGWINNNMLFNIEVKKFYMNPRISFRNLFAVNSTLAESSQTIPTSSKIKLDPLVISAGIGIRL